METLLAYVYFPLLALQDKTIQVQINGGRVWYHSPVWIAIGILAAVVILLLLALIVRGGGNTIVKD